MGSDRATSDSISFNMDRPFKNGLPERKVILIITSPVGSLLWSLESLTAASTLINNYPASLAVCLTTSS